MGRFGERMYDEYANKFTNDERYNLAYKKMKRIRGFYSHLRSYLVVNTVIIIVNLNRELLGKGIHKIGLLDWETYSTAIFWGIGLLAHGFSVFGRDIFFSDDWEQKKVKEFMDKESANSKWE